MPQHFLDLSHEFYDGMPGLHMKRPDGSVEDCTAHIRPFLSHAQSAPRYQGKASFEITEFSFLSSIGTRLDSPFHRFEGRRDIGQLALEEVVLPGVAIDVRGRAAGEAIGPEALPLDLDLSGKAVLFNLGWDAHWGTESYHSYPYLSRELLEALLLAKPKLVGVDAINIDTASDLERPAHTWFLERDILIVENLRGLDGLHGQGFRFFAVPLKAKRAAAMPVRAFAELGR